jgi:hypothetical protein
MHDLSVDVYSGESMLPVLFLSGSSQMITLSLMKVIHCFMIPILLQALIKETNFLLGVVAMSFKMLGQK